VLEPTAAEAKLLQMISDGDMPEMRAKRVLLGINTRIIRNREDVCERLAALVKSFPEEVRRTATDGRPLQLVLRTFAAPTRFSCYICLTCSLFPCSITGAFCYMLR